MVNEAGLVISGEISVNIDFIPKKLSGPPIKQASNTDQKNALLIILPKFYFVAPNAFRMLISFIFRAKILRPLPNKIDE